MSDSFRVAAVQATPVYLDREATVDKACKLIAEAGRNGASLAVFPESFVPAYPDWVWALPPGREDIQRQMYTQLVDNAVEIPGPATDKLCHAAKRAKTHVVVGVTERNTEASGGSLYNTLVYIDGQGDILGKHRKLVPTGAERLVWGQGDGSTLAAYDTPFGKLGGLICWENYMPLARYAMYAWGTQVYVAATWDRGEPWLSTLRHIAREGGVFVIGCCMTLRKSDIAAKAEAVLPFYKGRRDWINVGDSAIVDPDGEFVAGPLRMEEGILYAEVERSQLSGPKWMLDVAGHYGRPDVFELTVHTEPRPMISTDGRAAAAPAKAPRKVAVKGRRGK
ncbi:MAG: carbon-nitrogen hydrolase family protein [Dehalococcoidia bacterium]